MTEKKRKLNSDKVINVKYLKNDYTLHKDKERRRRYRKRHEKFLKTNDPTRAGFLSRLLWGDSTSLKKNISDR